MVKRFLILFIALLTAFHIQSATLKYLIVETKTGELYSFGLSDEPIITFENQMIQINSKSESHSFEISNVKEYTFSDTNVTGIENIRKNELRINSDANGQVVIEGIQPNSKVKVFSIDGKEQEGNISITDDKAFLNLTSLPKGIYIISVNNKSFKLYKK